MTTQQQPSGSQSLPSTPSVPSTQSTQYTLWKALAPIGLLLGFIAISLSFVFFPNSQWPNVIVAFISFMLAVPGAIKPSSFASTWHFIRKFANAFFRLLLRFFSIITNMLKMISAHIPWQGRNLLTIIAILLSIISLVTRFIPLGTSQTSGTTCPQGSQIVFEQDNSITEPVGISDGCIRFADYNGGLPDPAEVGIYRADQQYLKQPHITIVVPTILTGYDEGAVNGGESMLQGDAIEQQEYNRSRKSGQLPLVLLIANTGTDEMYANVVARDILQLAHKDHSIIGVVGWLYSTPETLQAVRLLGAAGILSVSPSITSNKFIGISDNFVRVVPPDLAQGVDMARYAKEQLHVQHLIICADYNNFYSASLADSVYNEFNDQTHHATILAYTRGQLNLNNGEAFDLGRRIVASVKNVPNAAVFFAGYIDDFEPLRGYLLSTVQSLPVLGGDGLDEIDRNNASNDKSFYYTAFSYYSLWEEIGMKPPVSEFFTDYAQTFNQYQTDPGAIGKAVAEGDAIQSYDAMLTLVSAYQIASQRQLSTPIAAGMLRNILRNTSIMGAGGLIQIGPEGYPLDKAIMIIHIDNNGNRALCGIYGQLLPNGSVPQVPACVSQA